MKKILIAALTVFAAAAASCQLPGAPGPTDSLLIPESQVLDLDLLVAEALLNNPGIRAAVHEMDRMAAKVPQATGWDDPKLTYSREEMPGFTWDEARYQKVELSQMVRFPGKRSTAGELAEIRAEHAHHDHLEKINEVLFSLKSAYDELWYAQQLSVLGRESIRLLTQLEASAETRYAVGGGGQQDVLKAQVELGKARNAAVDFRRRELAAKAELMSILNRAEPDTLGYAVIPEELALPLPLDSLRRSTLVNRSMLIHDSLTVREYSTERSLASREYYPDFTFSLEHMTGPVDGFNGWSVRAGISLPFMPWTLGKAGGRVDEAEAAIERSSDTYASDRAMVLADVNKLYYATDAVRTRLALYRDALLAKSRMSMLSGLSAYQTGQADFLSVSDAYRTLVDVRIEYFAMRLEYEQTLAALERAVGSKNIFLSR